MKKLLSLVAVLALVLTLAPVATVNAAADPVFYDETGAWQQIGGAWYFVVNYKMLNAPATGEVQLKYGTTVLATAAIGQPVALPYGTATTNIQYAASNLVLYLTDNCSKTIPITFYKFSTDLGAFASGDKVTFSAEVFPIYGYYEAHAGIKTPSYALVYTPYDQQLATVPFTVTVPYATDPSKIAAYKINQRSFNYYGPANTSSKQAYVSVYDDAGTLLYKYPLTVNKATFTFGTPVVTKVTDTKIGLMVPVTYGSGNVVPNGTDVNVKLGDQTFSGTINVISGASYLMVDVDKPAPGTYTYEVSSNLDTTDKTHVDGKGNFSFTWGAGLFLSGVTSWTQNATTPINVAVTGLNARIKRLWVSVDDPAGALDGNYGWSNDYFELPGWGVEFTGDSNLETPTVVYEANKVFYSVPAPKDYYWDVDQPSATIMVWPLRGGSFTVTVKALLSNNQFVTLTKTYNVSLYRWQIEVSNKAPKVGEVVTVTVTLTDRQGNPVNNAKVAVGTSESSITASVEGVTANVNNGVYTLKIPKTAAAGPYYMYVYERDGAGYKTTYNVKAKVVTISPADYYKVTLSATSILAGGQIEVKVVDPLDNKPVADAAVTVYNPVLDETYAANNTNAEGKTTIVTTDRRFSEYLGPYTVKVVKGDNAGYAEFSLQLPVSMTAPNDGIANLYLPETIVVETGTGMLPTQNSVELDTDTYYYTNASGGLDEKDAISLSYEKEVALNKLIVSGSFTLSDSRLDPAKLNIYVVYKVGDASYTIGTLTPSYDHKLEILVPAVYVGDFFEDFGVKVTDAHGNPVVGHLVYLKASDMANAVDAYTDKEGVAHFKNIDVVAGGTIEAWEEDTKLGLKDIRVAKTTRPAPKVAVDPTEITAGKDTNLTLTLVGADAKPVPVGKSVQINLGSFSYVSVIAADGKVQFKLPAANMEVGTMYGVVRVEGYEAASFTLKVNAAPVTPAPQVTIVLSLNQDIYTMNGQIKFWDAAPYIKNGRTMVPLRALAEALGFQVGWDGATKTVSIWKADQNPAVDTPYIMLQIGTTTAKVGSALYELDVAAEIVNNRTMVPLRFVAENLGYTVQWTPPSTVTLVKP
ncbi:copper amine oxidase N-terminal domain-containing protein [Coprothermobacteraceae bacterium]|nr:copper amine oxidase N-terminal domain-containing protein [Coprothermobacteraceae bacterium]